LFLKAGIAAILARVFPNFRYPLGVYLHITSKCNLKCAYCDYGKLNCGGGIDLSVADAFGLIDEMAAAGVMKLNITGGEPLLHSNIGEIIDYAKKKKMFVVISTNGLLISDRLEALSSADVIMISFDGTKENHERLRGQNTYDKLIAAFENLRKSKIAFWTSTTLNKYNIADIDFILDMAEKYGTFANFALIQFFNEINRDNSLPDYEKVKDLMPDDAAARRTFAELLRLKNNGRRVGSSAEFLKFMMRWNDYKQLLSQDDYGIKCFAGRLYCHLYYDKKLYACGHCRGNLAPVDLSEYGFKDAFRRLIKLNCNSCRVACDTENNIIYNLNFRSIFNWLAKFN